MLCSRINKGKAPKEVSGALTELKDLMAFHQNVSVAMGTALQHLADSLFVHLANLVLIHRDSYLDFVKPGVKEDTMNLLHNAPLFGYAVFPDAAINTAKQDISKFEAAGVAPQHTTWCGSHRYRPYEHQESRTSASNDQSAQQPWRQFSRNCSRGRGRGRGSNPRFSETRPFKQYK